MKQRITSIFLVLMLCLSIVTGCNMEGGVTGSSSGSAVQSLSEVPEYNGEEYVVIHDNEPDFTEDELTTKSYETYSELDRYDRCGVAMACVGTDIMPTEKRGNIGQVKPSGWQTVKYDIVDGKYLYNRCHLIGYQLTGENANEKNLITGTRFFNVDGMLPFEDMVADYVKETDNHVLYRVTPVFEGENLVASGVQMEAYSVEDEGEGICYNVYVYNVQPGIEIDYATGDSWLETTEETTKKTDQNSSETDKKINSYVLNTNTKKFHDPSCASAKSTKEENKETYKGTRESLIKQGYEPCGRCKP